MTASDALKRAKGLLVPASRLSGAAKTAAMRRRQARAVLSMDVLAALFFAFMTPSQAMALLACLLAVLCSYGAWCSLSMRIRALEQAAEEKAARKGR